MHEFMMHLNELVRQRKLTEAQKHEMLKAAAKEFSESAKFYNK